MENNQSKTTVKKTKKIKPMQKIGKSIKDTFIEMSNSLAGWIDDTSAQFSGKKLPKKESKDTTSSGAKFVTHRPKTDTK